MNRTSVLAAKRRRRESNTGAETEEDGTQVERAPPTANGGKNKKSVMQKANKNDVARLDKALKEFCQQVIALGVPALCNEFNEIKIQTQGIGKYTKAAFDAHTDKNRYKDVFCVDDTRVILKWPPGKDDYIHANWVNCPDAKGRFICTQGPTEKSLEEFWRMIYQEKCRSIVMLCNIVEQGKKKCEQYWPTTAGEVMDVGCLKVKALGCRDVEQVLTQTRLELTDEKDTKFVVEHFAWNNWPDRGVPDNFLACFRLLNRVKDLTPIVVHCSAGIGRTGTIVGLDILQTRLMRGEVPTLEKIVRELRDSRHGSVQMDIQYVYMARVLIALAQNKKLVTKDELVQWMADYDTLCKARGC